MLHAHPLLTLATMHPWFFIKAARYVVFPPGALAISTLMSRVSIRSSNEDQIEKTDGVLRDQDCDIQTLSPSSGASAMQGRKLLAACRM